MTAIIRQLPFINFQDINICKNFAIAYQVDLSKSVAYDIEYYNKYIAYENTDIAIAINTGRVNLVQKYCKTVIDIGIGSGEFIKNSKEQVVYGYDINKYAIEWLKNEHKYVNPYVDNIDSIDGITLWDTLEHIPNPDLLLNRLKPNQYAIISIPIFKDLFQLKLSKHYRPNEHYYYYTAQGLILYMEYMGFNCLEITDFETQAGRESVLSFVFMKLDSMVHG